MGGITEIATGAPGYNSILPNAISPLARTPKLNGYSTAQFGKCHEAPVWETSPVGPFDAWPTGGGKAPGCRKARSRSNRRIECRDNHGLSLVEALDRSQL